MANDESHVRIIGTAVLKCKVCGKTKELTISADKSDYKNDYTSLTKLGHVCELLHSDKAVLGKFDIVGIYFKDGIEIVSDSDVVAFNSPPLKIDWTKENKI